jgi:tRNA threonylcarbamoyladenosine biosynthesis protein TsaE
MKKKYISRSEKDTLSIGQGLGQKAGAGAVFALFGELGSGKTVIAKGIARGLGVEDEVTSASFTLLEIYSGRVPLYHFDLYRIESAAELDRLFFEEYWEGEGVSVIEWADRAGARLPEGSVTIRIECLNESKREITIEYPGD